MLRPGVTGVILSVIDHGRGIPADKLETIFGRFQQVDASDSRQKGGTGLGLAICRTIVLQHSGRIWAERNPVRGSTFRIFLPYHPAPMPSAGGVMETEPGHGTVVLADANPETRPRIAAQLARHGYSVVQAAHSGANTVCGAPGPSGHPSRYVAGRHERLGDFAATAPHGLSFANPSRFAERRRSANPRTSCQPAPRDGFRKPLQEDMLLTELARVLCGTGDKARILIVEDDHDLARVISEVFTRDSITVQTAHTLKETIEACSAFKPHLMVLDIGLPDGDGFNVVDWLRQHNNLAQLPLVVYSGRELSPDERSQLTLGPTYFLAKTRVQPQQLEALVLTMLRSSRRPKSPYRRKRSYRSHNRVGAPDPIDNAAPASDNGSGGFLHWAARS